MNTTSTRPKGTTDDPIRRDDNLCAYNGCTTRHQELRITHSGAVAAYCTKHAQQARLLFDKT